MSWYCFSVPSCCVGCSTTPNCSPRQSEAALWQAAKPQSTLVVRAITVASLAASSLSALASSSVSVLVNCDRRWVCASQTKA